MMGLGGHWHWIDPESTPQGALPKSLPNYFKGPAGGGDRSCVVSYKKEKKRYLGVGWGGGKFQEIPLENNAPFTPQWGTVSNTAQANTSKWGYSCYIDQDELIYYSAYANQSPAAIDLKTMTPTTGKSQKGSGTGNSYAMSGDKSGNPLGGSSTYTMAYESETDTIWTSGQSGFLNVSPAECVISNVNCAQETQFNSVALGAHVKPISSLGGGRVVGLVRAGGGSTVWLLSLKNPKKISDGLNLTRLADLSGDPYMYTDFTGATLYLTDAEETYNFKSDLGNVVHPAVGFAWDLVPDAKSSDEWKDMELEIRCYKSGESKGQYEKVNDVEVAGKMTFIRTTSCENQKYDSVDVKVVQLNDAKTLLDVERMQITLY
jgi:hypothetical protein